VIRVLVGRSGVRILADERNFSHPKRPDPLRAHPNSYLIGTEAVSGGEGVRTLN